MIQRTFMLAAMLLVMASTLLAQTPQQIATLKAQANAMATAIKKQDFKTVIKMTNPKVVAAAGGEAKLLEQLSKGMGMMKAKGMNMSISNVVIGEPSPFIKVKKQLQCTVPDKLEVKMIGGTISTNSTLIAISDDDGKTWNFIDAVGKNIAALKKVLPNLSDKLVIAKTEQPQFVPDKL
ncbi:MAG: hypothetical protein QM541_14365 [Flavobacterium sp.]|nr:hypothetical protein [Flavobacterium sp.]